MLFSVTTFVVICYSSHRRPILASKPKVFFSSLWPQLVFYDCTTNDHKLDSLTAALPPSFVGQKSRGMDGFSAQDPSRSNSRWWLAVFLSGGSGEESIIQLIQVVGRIQLLAVVRLRFSVPYWLSAPRGHLHSLPCGPFHSQHQQQRSCFAWYPSHFRKGSDSGPPR